MIDASMFSLRLKELRQANNLSQKELAKILNVSTGTVGNWEAGTREPDFAMAIKIADFFNASLDMLLGREIRRDVPIRECVSPMEKQMLTAFRAAGTRHGEAAQRAIISITELIAKQ